MITLLIAKSTRSCHLPTPTGYLPAVTRYYLDHCTTCHHHRTICRGWFCLLPAATNTPPCLPPLHLHATPRTPRCPLCTTATCRLRDATAVPACHTAVGLRIHSTTGYTPAPAHHRHRRLFPLPPHVLPPRFFSPLPPATRYWVTRLPPLDATCRRVLFPACCSPGWLLPVPLPPPAHTGCRLVSAAGFCPAVYRTTPPFHYRMPLRTLPTAAPLHCWFWIPTTTRDAACHPARVRCRDALHLPHLQFAPTAPILPPQHTCTAHTCRTLLPPARCRLSGYLRFTCHRPVPAYTCLLPLRAALPACLLLRRYRLHTCAAAPIRSSAPLTILPPATTRQRHRLTACLLPPPPATTPAAPLLPVTNTCHCTCGALPSSAPCLCYCDTTCHLHLLPHTTHCRTFYRTTHLPAYHARTLLVLVYPAGYLYAHYLPPPPATVDFLRYHHLPTLPTTCLRVRRHTDTAGYTAVYCCSVTLIRSGWCLPLPAYHHRWWLCLPTIQYLPATCHTHTTVILLPFTTHHLHYRTCLLPLYHHLWMPTGCWLHRTARPLRWDHSIPLHPAPTPFGSNTAFLDHLPTPAHCACTPPPAPRIGFACGLLPPAACNTCHLPLRRVSPATGSAIHHLLLTPGLVHTYLRCATPHHLPLPPRYTAAPAAAVGFTHCYLCYPAPVTTCYYLPHLHHLPMPSIPAAQPALIHPYRTIRLLTLQHLLRMPCRGATAPLRFVHLPALRVTPPACTAHYYRLPPAGSTCHCFATRYTYICLPPPPVLPHTPAPLPHAGFTHTLYATTCGYRLHHCCLPVLHIPHVPPTCLRCRLCARILLPTPPHTTCRLPSYHLHLPPAALPLNGPTIYATTYRGATTAYHRMMPLYHHGYTAACTALPPSTTATTCAPAACLPHVLPPATLRGAPYLLPPATPFTQLHLLPPAHAPAAACYRGTCRITDCTLPAPRTRLHTCFTCTAAAPALTHFVPVALPPPLPRLPALSPACLPLPLPGLVHLPAYCLHLAPPALLPGISLPPALTFLLAGFCRTTSACLGCQVWWLLLLLPFVVFTAFFVAACCAWDLYLLLLFTAPPHALPCYLPAVLHLRTVCTATPPRTPAGFYLRCWFCATAVDTC